MKIALEIHLSRQITLLTQLGVHTYRLLHQKASDT